MNLKIQILNFELQIVAAESEFKDPWKGFEPYLDEAVKKTCGKQSTCKLPAVLQRYFFFDIISQLFILNIAFYIGSI